MKSLEIVSFPLFDRWQQTARNLLCNGVTPDRAFITDDTQGHLFASKRIETKLTSNSHDKSFVVSQRFLQLAKAVICHRKSDSPKLLYAVLWKLTHGHPKIVSNPLDRDVSECLVRERQVRRDLHKMHAFVRFRKDEKFFIAWHKPDHFIVRLAVPFFVNRFGSMQWQILTPDESAYWNGTTVEFFAGVPHAPHLSDPTEINWLSYYSATFNPARVNMRAMKAEMAVRHWPTLPEAKLIPELLHKARERVASMEQKVVSAAAVPVVANLEELGSAAKNCRACALHCNATQTIFGEGSPSARIVIVGEQPGDEEDLYGRPFIGPAGKLLMQAFEAAGIDRKAIYLTNAVKHFKFEQRGKRRLHKRPSSADVRVCKPWLEAELKMIKPAVVVCLGATAAHSVLGRTVHIENSLKQIFQSGLSPCVLVTYHPAAILRIPDHLKRNSVFAALVESLQHALLLENKGGLKTTDETESVGAHKAKNLDNQEMRT